MAGGAILSVGLTKTKSTRQSSSQCPDATIVDLNSEDVIYFGPVFAFVRLESFFQLWASKYSEFTEGRG